MHLHSLQVENYRAIRRAALTFGPATALIGENDSGKSSLIEALVTLLDPRSGESPPEFLVHHFHHQAGDDEPLGILRITLTFREREAGDWETPHHEAIASLLPPTKWGLREIRLQVRAKLELDKTILCEWRLYAPRSKKASSEPSLLVWLRNTNPIIHLPPGALTGHGVDHYRPLTAQPRSVDAPPQFRELVSTIETTSQALLNRSTLNLADDMAKGFAAVRELIEQVTLSSDPGKPTLARKVREILGKEQATPSRKLSLALPGSGGSSEQLGILLLVAALLRCSPGGLTEEVEPVWIIEDPEAHLHPMTLASVGYFLADIHWQKIITTNSSTMIGSLPLGALRRITRIEGDVKEHLVNVGDLTRTEMRRIGYHLGARNGSAPFARLWLLVEGESEIWILPQLARLLGYELAVEGIQCIEFAQSGLTPLVRVAHDLGIDWHLLADGDKAGHNYLSSVRQLVRRKERESHFTLLAENDIEHCFWEHGYSHVFLKYANLSKRAVQGMSPSQIINRAVKNRSKPDLALRLIEAAALPDSPGVPPLLEQMIKTCIGLARKANQARPER